MKRKRATGVSLIELLVVLAILGLLATLAIPVFVQRAEQAKVKVAMEETNEMARSEELCGAMHGFYIPIQVLDDLPVDYGTRDTKTDDLLNEPTIYLIDLSTDLLSQLVGQLTLQDTTNPRVRMLWDTWQGPFLNPQRVYLADYTTPDPRVLPSELISRDYPLDPWGQPYRLYSPIGMVGTGAESTTNFNNDTFSDGRLIAGRTKRFDRFAIVSFGPDGQEDPVGGPHNDIIHVFGILPETVYYF